jgi:hypothetical protein
MRVGVLILPERPWAIAVEQWRRVEELGLTTRGPTTTSPGVICATGRGSARFDVDRGCRRDEHDPTRDTRRLTELPPPGSVRA